MMRHYCTLFDRAYLAKGLVLHESLLRHSSEPFTLHILAMDAEALTVLHELGLQQVQLLPLASFEQVMHLAKVREGRTWAEYCWTSASNLMEYLMLWLDDGVTYLDSDLMFFSDPQVMFDELGKRSIAIVPHRLIPEKKHLEVNGIFNVGWVTAQNTPAGRKCIQTWAKQCRDWCFNRVEGPKFADQKYLDTWPGDYPGEVQVIQNIGANVAPWNVANWRVDEGPTVNGVPICFYHFHEFQELAAGVLQLTNYPVRAADSQFIYDPYIEAYTRAKVRIQAAEKSIRNHRRVMELESERA